MTPFQIENILRYISRKPPIVDLLHTRMLNGLPRISFAISYGLSFAALTATIVHTFRMYQICLFSVLEANGWSSVVWYRHDIARQFRSTLRDESDVHARLMQAYPEVPQWWYALMGFIAFVLGVITIVVWDTKVCTVRFDKQG